MRPKRLIIEGFASFRDRAVVNFDDADLFALTGPTGAGKSSILDAMAFALYGSVCRYDDARMIAPAICQGLNEMKVRFDFFVDGRDYTAVRVVRRTKTGANTDEGRLESNGSTLAGTAKELTAAIANKVIGLNFDQFTTCVMLPQGDFAQFLHAKGKVRQDLLVRLLGMELFREVQQKASQRAATADAECATLRGRLTGDLASATAAAVEEARLRVETLNALAERFQADQPVIDALVQEERDAQAATSRARHNAEKLRAIALPAGVTDLGQRLANAQRAAGVLKKEAAQASEAATRAQEEVNALPSRAELVLLKADHVESERLAEDIEETRGQLEHAEGERDQAHLRELALREERETAGAVRDRILRSDAAYHASQGLSAGDACPVCGEVLEAAPSLEPPTGLDAAENVLRELDRNMVALRSATARHEKEHATCESRLATLEGARTPILERLSGRPSHTETIEIIAALDEAERLLGEARIAESGAHDAEAAASLELDELAREETQAWPAFRETHASVADLGPPLAPADDLSLSWTTLTAWAGEQADVEDQSAVDAEKAAASAATARAELLDSQARACAEHGVPTAAQAPVIAVATAGGAAEASHQSLAVRLGERETVEADLEQELVRAGIARALRDALRSDRFEKWYLAEALSRLATGGSQLLNELSGGAYSLGLNTARDDFEVIDHLSADERRSVRTLSGGETFLASLCLALSLAEEVSAMAASGAQRLDALFLDEGFGTLDAETLDTVAGAIEELGSRGRMVGIVTHVRELAARVPVQFQVRKDAGTSRVDRVDV